MKKVTLISLICILLGSIGYGVYYFTLIRQRQIYAHEIISRLGGESEIKKYCIKQRTGPIEMENGETLPRYLSLQDIDRINKMCDCVVEKSYKRFADREIISKLETIDWNADMVEFLKFALMSEYMICEIEVQEMLNKKYKFIDTNS